MKEARDLLPIYKIEHNCILSRQGDITVGFKVQIVTMKAIIRPG
jgi:hypothetical protein